MRGAGHDCPLARPRRRIIPAHAGSSQTERRSFGTSRDHPRACGEQLSGPLDTTNGRGSSPRMRGAACDVDRHVVAEGIIPAHAGSSPCMAGRSIREPDHPRACGEQSCYARSLPLPTGSSPRMRGAARPLRASSLAAGIIPAHAGSRRPCQRLASFAWDHPRACGAQVDYKLSTGSTWGSSPRMRGAVKGMIESAKQPGIIPAHAGSS